MRHSLVHNEVGQVPAISLREPVGRDRRENRFGHQACTQDGKLSEERNRRILMSGQMSSSPYAYPGDQSKRKDRVTQDAFGQAHLCRIQSEPRLDVGKELFDGPAPRETLNQKIGLEIQVGRRQIRGFALATRISHDNNLKLGSGLRPPGDKGFEVERHELAVNLDANSLPAATGLSHRCQTWKTAAVLGLAAPLFDFSFGERGSEDCVETQAAGQGNSHGKQRLENGLIVVGAVGNERNLEGNPGLDLLERLDRKLQPGTKLRFGTVFFGSVKGDPERQRHRRPKQLDDYGQDYPIVAPDVAGTGTAGVIPERAGAEDVFAPFGTQRIVDDDEKVLQLKGLDDQDEKRFEESFRAEFEMRKETVEAGFVAFETCSVTELADMPLTGLDQPGDRRGAQIRPTPFGKSQTKTEENLGKVRCRVVVNHSPFLQRCEMVSSPSTSENGLFFLSALSSVNP